MTRVARVLRTEGYHSHIRRNVLSILTAGRAENLSTKRTYSQMIANMPNDERTQLSVNTNQLKQCRRDEDNETNRMEPQDVTNPNGNKERNPTNHH